MFWYHQRFLHLLAWWPFCFSLHEHQRRHDLVVMEPSMLLSKRKRNVEKGSICQWNNSYNMSQWDVVVSIVSNTNNGTKFPLTISRTRMCSILRLGCWSLLGLETSWRMFVSHWNSWSAIQLEMPAFVCQVWLEWMNIQWEDDVSVIGWVEPLPQRIYKQLCSFLS